MTNHHVYFVQLGDLIKIGTTNQLAARLYSYPPNAVVLATVAGNRSRERMIHKKFSHLRAERNEWFQAAPELLAYISGIQDADVAPDSTEPMTSVHELSRRMWELRNERGWTQDELCERAGVSRRFLCDLEGGKETVRTESLLAVLTALGHGLLISESSRTAALA